ncbi:MAG: PKD domain-containing protein, partial [Crocinitomicaceae bacterium]
PYSFDWGAGSVPDNFSNGLPSGNYSITIFDAAGCDSTLSYDILNDPFVVSASVVNDISCFGFNDGEAIALGPNPLSVYTYQWGGSANNQTTEIATNLPPGSHDVTITSSGGCSETVSVSIQEPSALTLSTVDACICEGDLFTLSALASGATPNYSFNWVNSQGQAQNPTDITITQTETYTVTVLDANGCSLSDNLTITSLETPIASFTVNENEACVRPVVDFSFQNTSTPAGTLASWDFGDNSIGSGDAVTHQYISPGFYTISLVVDSPNGCSDTLTEIDYITIHDSPIADFSFTPEVATTFNPNVQFIDLSSNDAISWNWTFGNTTSSDQNPTQNYAGSFGSQEINLEVENIHGCIDSTTRFLEVEEGILVLAPNAFTPDGDEFNQTWKMHLVGLDVFDVEINIYNRWGELIWQSFNVEVPWDGTYNGQIVPDGMYTWTLKVGDLNTDEVYERVGHVTVLR